MRWLSLQYHWWSPGIILSASQNIVVGEVWLIEVRDEHAKGYSWTLGMVCKIKWVSMDPRQEDGMGMEAELRYSRWMICGLGVIQADLMRSRQGWFVAVPELPEVNKKFRPKTGCMYAWSSLGKPVRIKRVAHPDRLTPSAHFSNTALGTLPQHIAHWVNVW
jgi:hypothetical protein